MLASQTLYRNRLNAVEFIDNETFISAWPIRSSLEKYWAEDRTIQWYFKIILVLLLALLLLQWTDFIDIKKNSLFRNLAITALVIQSTGGNIYRRFSLKNLKHCITWTMLRNWKIFKKKLCLHADNYLWYLEAFYAFQLFIAKFASILLRHNKVLVTVVFFSELQFSFVYCETVR